MCCLRLVNLIYSAHHKELYFNLILLLSQCEAIKQWQAREGKEWMYRDVRFSYWVSVLSADTEPLQTPQVSLIYGFSLLKCPPTHKWISKVVRWWDVDCCCLFRSQACSSWVLCNQGLRNSWSRCLQWAPEGSVPPPYTQGGGLSSC